MLKSPAYDRFVTRSCIDRGVVRVDRESGEKKAQNIGSNEMFRNVLIIQWNLQGIAETGKIVLSYSILVACNKNLIGEFIQQTTDLSVKTQLAIKRSREMLDLVGVIKAQKYQSNITLKNISKDCL